MLYLTKYAKENEIINTKCIKETITHKILVEAEADWERWEYQLEIVMTDGLTKYFEFPDGEDMEKEKILMAQAKGEE